MQPPRPLLRFLAVFSVVYGLLIAPWPGWNAAYSAYFRGLSAGVFSTSGPNAFVHFDAAPAGAALDTQVHLANPRNADARGDGPVKLLSLDSRGLGWIPTALFLALWAATALTPRRRAITGAAGLLALHVYLLACVGSALLNEASGADPASFIRLGPALKRVSEGLEETLVNQVGASFVVPVVLWLLLCLGSGQWAGIERQLARPQRGPLSGSSARAD